MTANEIQIYFFGTLSFLLSAVFWWHFFGVSAFIEGFLSVFKADDTPADIKPPLSEWRWPEPDYSHRTSVRERQPAQPRAATWTPEPNTAVSRPSQTPIATGATPMGDLTARFHALFGPDAPDHPKLPKAFRQSVYERLHVMFNDDRAPKRKAQKFRSMFHPDTRAKYALPFTDDEVTTIFAAKGFLFDGDENPYSAGD